MNVSIENLAVSFGSQVVFEDVSTSVSDGEFVGLVGPNGAGKTTLLGTVNGTLAPDAGRVVLGDDPVSSLGSREIARRVATVPQETSVAFDFPVRRIVEMGRHPHRPRFGPDPDPAAVDQAMKRVDVAAMADRPIGSLSGGERQRAMLARALAQDAPLLVLDEPTASLDVNHQVRTFDLVRDLVADGKTVVAAIHDLNLAARYCDRLVALANGGIVADGPPDAVLTPETIQTAFGTAASVTDHPVTGTPLVTALGAASTGDKADLSAGTEDPGSGRETDETVTSAPIPSDPSGED